MKKWIHSEYYKDVPVQCICGAEFKVNTTVKWPIKVETCYQCHPVFNKDKVIKKVVKWRMEKFLEKQKKMDSIKKVA
jgi:ribosomal protein L31